MGLGVYSDGGRDPEASDNREHLGRDLREVKEAAMAAIPGPGTGPCKGPGVGMSLGCWGTVRKPVAEPNGRQERGGVTRGGGL